MKKIFIIIAIFSMIFSLCSCGDQIEDLPEDTYEDYKEYDYHGYQYYFVDENVKTRKAGDYLISDFKDGICINQYLGNKLEVVIPENINDKKVIKLSCSIVDDCSLFSKNEISSISLPKYIQYIDHEALYCIDTLQSISVDSDNPYYTSDDGILYNNDKSVVLYVPRDYQKEELVLDDSLLHIGIFSIESAKNVKKLKIGKLLKSLQNIDGWHLDSDTFPYKLESIFVSEDNPYFTSENGVLYNKDKTELICYPSEKPDEEYFLPETVFSIGSDNRALVYTKHLKVLTVHKNIKELDFHYFEGESYEDGLYAEGTSIITVKGYKDTAAETFAKKNNLEFIALD